jgi:ATP-dependent Clp protease ATP-binding subunit ClpX
MSSKQPPRADIAAPPVSAAVAILEFGRLLFEEDQRQHAARKPAQLQEAEERLIARLSTDKNSLLKPALNFNISKPIDRITLRALAVVAYQQLCGTKFAGAISDVGRVVAGGNPATVIEARQTISRLLITKQLQFRENSTDRIELGAAMLDLLAGGKEAAPITITERELWRRWRKADAEVAKRKAKASFENLPSAKQLAAKLSETVIGLDAQVRTFACRTALHQRRAAMIRAGNDPGSPNEALLFIGPSGCGKTYLAETAGRVCGLPFAASSATDMSCTGYVGLDVDDAIKAVITAADNDVEKARFGFTFIDELDKKRASNWEHGSRDVAGASVQQGLLRLIEGCEFQVGGRKGSFDWIPTTINTKGMFFVMAGAFVGLEELMGKIGAHGIGFGNRQDGSRQQQFLYDGLVDFGMIPELINRLSGILVFPAPTVEQLTQIAEHAVIPAYQRLLAGCGADIQVTGDGIALMAQSALESRTFARGVKTIVARLIEDAVFEERKGSIQFDVAEVAQAIEVAGLASGEARTECH